MSSSRPTWLQIPRRHVDGPRNGQWCGYCPRCMGNLHWERNRLGRAYVLGRYCRNCSYFHPTSPQERK